MEGAQEAAGTDDGVITGTNNEKRQMVATKNGVIDDVAVAKFKEEQ